jgi:hypothetical protein
MITDDHLNKSAMDTYKRPERLDSGSSSDRKTTNLTMITGEDSTNKKIR